MGATRSAWWRAVAWLVHLYTASGAVLALLALAAVSRGRLREALWWMLVAALVDASDGTLARAARVREVLPGFDGRKLDDVVDYLNYAVVPAAFLYQGGFFPLRADLFFASLPLVASGYGFCQAQAKTDDHFFTGFPSYWNVVAFYLHAGTTPQWLNAALVLLLSVFVFVPLRYLYPSRTPWLRRTTNLLGLLWLGSLVAVLYRLPRPSVPLLALSLFYPAYYAAVSFYLHWRLHRSKS